MIYVQSAFRTTPGAVTWLWTAAVMFAGGSSLSAHADPAAGDPADHAMASIHVEARCGPQAGGQRVQARCKNAKLPTS